MEEKIKEMIDSYNKERDERWNSDGLYLIDCFIDDLQSLLEYKKGNCCGSKNENRK